MNQQGHILRLDFLYILYYSAWIIIQLHLSRWSRTSCPRDFACTATSFYGSLNFEAIILDFSSWLIININYQDSSGWSFYMGGKRRRNDCPVDKETVSWLGVLSTSAVIEGLWGWVRGGWNGDREQLQSLSGERNFGHFFWDFWDHVRVEHCAGAMRLEVLNF